LRRTDLPLCPTLSQVGGVHGTPPLTDCLIENNSADNTCGGIRVNGGTTTLLGATTVPGDHADANSLSGGGGIQVNVGTLSIAETCRVTRNTAATGRWGASATAPAMVTLQGAAMPSPIVVDNCHENCVGSVPNCADLPVSC
jgi:hypothetical protein